jgi:CheY-like chemotaxis protein
VEQFSRGRLTVIVAEDVEAIRHVVCGMLESAGCAVLPAENGRAAIQIAEASERPIDLLITDLEMPGMGGLELAKALMKLQSEMRVLFMSGSYDKSTSEIHGDGTDRFFLLKPFSREQLLQRVEEVLA